MVSQGKKDCLTVKVFDVGHGDSILVEFPDGKNLGIIDCNTHSASNRGAGCDDYDSSEPKILAYLNDKLKAIPDYIVRFICLSHYHIDHYRGMGCLMRTLQDNGTSIEEFWDPGVSKRKFQMLREMAEKGNPETLEKADQLRDLFCVLYHLRKEGKLQHKPVVKMERQACVISGVRIDMIAPYCNHWSDYTDYVATSRNFISQKEHLVCSAIMMTYGRGRIILGSDLPNSAWEEIVEKHKGKPLRSHFVKASHHGSVEGNFLPNDQSLWKRIAFSGRTVAAISGGYRSDISLEKTIQELDTFSVPTYCTGNLLKQYSEESEFLKALLPDAKEFYVNDSRSVTENCDSYHGDITVYIERDGLTKVETELVTAPL